MLQLRPDSTNLTSMCQNLTGFVELLALHEHYFIYSSLNPNGLQALFHLTQKIMGLQEKLELRKKTNQD